MKDGGEGVRGCPARAATGGVQAAVVATVHGANGAQVTDANHVRPTTSPTAVPVGRCSSAAGDEAYPAPLCARGCERSPNSNRQFEGRGGMSTPLETTRSVLRPAHNMLTEK